VNKKTKETIVMLELRHNKENGGEFLTKEQIAGQLNTYKYIVVGMFCRDEDFDGATTAPILYKGDAETEAKKVWKEKAMLNNILFCEHGFFGSEIRCWLDVSDVEYIPHGIETKVVNYPVGFFEPDDSLGEMALTAPIEETAEDLWYVVRVCDIDLTVPSLVGQIVYKGGSKQEAVDVWLDYKGGGFSSCYIFNPSQINKAE
jgi:hypothetical protein